MPKPIPQVHLVVVTTNARLGFNVERFFTLLSVTASQQPTDAHIAWQVDQRLSRSAPWLVRDSLAAGALAIRRKELRLG